MEVLYFAWLRSKTGIAQETVSPPAEIDTVAKLLEWLKERSPRHAEALGDLSVVRVAVNEEYAEPGAAVSSDDEVALFPPVTGGAA